MKKKNMGMNAVLNVIKYSMAFIFPLITYPYAFRIIGAEGIGKVNYSNSILTYFSLLAMLGVSTYGIREGSKRKNNKEEFNEFANQLFTINVLSTFCAYVLLLITVLSIGKFHSYAGLIALQSVSILLTTLGLDWINSVYEDFLFITVRSVVAHFISLGLLFLLVHKPEDYYYYALLTISTNGLTCITNWFYCRKYAKVRLTKSPHIRTHIRPLLYIFFNVLTISIYVNFDITMLGWIKGDYEVGVYSVAVKIYNIVKNIMVAIYAVAVPRLSAIISEKDYRNYKKVFTDVWNYVGLLLMPAGVGLFCVADDIMALMGVEQLNNEGFSLQILSLSLIFAIFGGLTTAVLNVTLGREKDNMIASFIGAGLNFSLNFFFIPFWGMYGAAFTTMLSEAVVFVFCFIRVRNKKQYMDFTLIVKSLLHSLIASGIMAIVALFIHSMLNPGTVRLLVIISISAVVYVMVLSLLKDEYLTNAFGIVRKKIGKGRFAK